MITVVKRKTLIWTLILACLFVPNMSIVNAKGDGNNGLSNVVVVYSSEKDNIDEHQRMLDMIIGHFTNNISFYSSSELNKIDLNHVDYLFYYGQVKESLSHTVRETISEFKGPIIALGYNTEQLGDRFAFLEKGDHPGVIDQAIIKNRPEKRLSFIAQSIESIKLKQNDQTDILLLGKKGHQLYPLLVKHHTDYYFASNLVRPPFSILLAEVLHDVFKDVQLHHSDVNPGYIRLEDIHPFVDPKPLKEIAELLAEKKIPYMIAVIPVYTNPETKKQYHFSDSPKLLKVLKYMQENGGSIVLHGYTHQFRLSETGEGFEFWDVEHNMPIYHHPDEEVFVKTHEDFNSRLEYEEFLNKQKVFERHYIEDRLTKGIEELANYGLYPLAFEAPHYTMSQNGYEVVSRFFTTYVGQIQLSDEDWEIMKTSPYISSPTFLHGMTLLPETMGYVEPNNSNAIDDMIVNANDYMFVDDGMVAGFYHPYLGIERFKELLQELENIPNINWIDLKQLDNHTQTERVDIHSQSGNVSVEIERLGLFMTSFDYFHYHFKNVITIILWCMATIGILAVLYFIYHIVSNRHKQSQQDERRNMVG